MLVKQLSVETKHNIIFFPFSQMLILPTLAGFINPYRNDLSYFLTFCTYKMMLKNYITNLRTNRIYSNIVGFAYFRFVLFSGLGYKRRSYKKYKLLFTYIGDRHWILKKISYNFLIATNKRRSFIFFSYSKGALTNNYNFFSSLRKPYIYKIKGFIDSRVRGRFLFVRRLRISGVQTKLSKKQKLL